MGLEATLSTGRDPGTFGSFGWQLGYCDFRNHGMKALVVC